MEPLIDKIIGESTTNQTDSSLLIRKTSDDLLSEFFKDFLSDVVEKTPATEISLSNSLLRISLSDQVYLKDRYSDSDIDELIKNIDTPTKTKLNDLFPDDSISFQDDGWSLNYNSHGDCISNKGKIQSSDFNMQTDIELCLDELRKDEKLWQEQMDFPIRKSLINLSDQGSSNSGLSTDETLGKKLMGEVSSEKLDGLKFNKKGNDLFFKCNLDYVKDGHDKQRDRLVANSIMSLAKIEEQPEIELEELIVEKSLLEEKFKQESESRNSNETTVRTHSKRQKTGVIRMSYEKATLSMNAFNILLNIPPKEPNLDSHEVSKPKMKISNSFKKTNELSNPTNKKSEIEKKYGLLVQNINSIVNGENSISKLRQLAKRLSKNNHPRVTKSSQVSKLKKQEDVKCNKTQSSPHQSTKNSVKSTGKVKKNTDSITLPSEMKSKIKRFEIQNESKNKRKLVKSNENSVVKFQDIWEKIKQSSKEVNEKENFKKIIPKVYQMAPLDSKTISPTVRSNLKKNLYSLLEQKEKENQVIENKDLGDLNQISPYSIKLHHGIPEPANPKYVTSETRLLNSITAEVIKPISAEYTRQKHEEKSIISDQKSTPKFTKTQQFKSKKEFSILTFNDILRLKILANNLTNYFRRSGRSFDTIVPLTVKYLYGKGRGLTRHQANIWKQYNSSKNYFVGNQQYGDTTPQPPVVELPNKNNRKREDLIKDDVQKAKELRELINAGGGGADTKQAVLSLEKLIHRLYLESKSRSIPKLDVGNSNPEVNVPQEIVSSKKEIVWSVQGRPLSVSLSDPNLTPDRVKDNPMPLIQKLLDDSEAVSLTNVSRKNLISVNPFMSLEK